jgi:hypothetical protein
MTPPHRDEGLSEAVGFILILAVIIMTISIYLLYLMPAIGRENEIAQMAQVKERFTEYKQNIDTLWTSRQCQSEFGPALSLGSGDTTGILSYFPFFSPSKAGAVLALNQRVENITITSDSYFLVSSGGYSESGTITNIPGTLNVNTTPLHFYINVSTSDLLTDRWVLINGPTWDVSVNITPNYFYSNRFNLTLNSTGYIQSFWNWTEYRWNSTDITVKTYSGSSPVVSNLPVYLNISTSRVYTVDLMSPVYGISTQFQSPQSVNVSKSDNTVTASYDVRYGFIPIISTSTQPLGAIEYRSNNLYYTPQTYYYQLGGVFLEQADGSVNEIPPAISISVVNSSPVVNVGEILLRGGVTSTQVSGSGPITVASAVTDLSSPSLTAGNNTRWVNLSIQAASTNASEMWNRTFQDLADRGGLPVTSYTIGRSGNVSFLNITGNPQIYDVRLSLTQVNVSADYVEEYSTGGISRSWRNVPGFAPPGSAMTTTTTTLSASTNSSTYGNPVTFTATVTPTSGSGTPTGTVTFYNGSVPLGTATLSSGSASLSTSTLPVGTHSITATYNGDGNYQTSTSNAVSLNVNTSTPPPGYIPWYNCAWTHRKNITIDKAKVNGTVSDFPVLINFTSDSDLQAYALGTGDDILFTKSDGTTKLSHEFELYQSGSGGLIAWVKIPSPGLSSAANTSIYMYYGNPAASNQEDKTGGVWSNYYQAVWHLRELGVGGVGEFKDSTSNHNNGQGGQTGANPPARVNAKIGYGQDFTSSNNQFIQIPDAASLQITGPITIEAWIYGHDWSDPGGGYRSVLGRQYGTGSGDAYQTAVSACGAGSCTPYTWLTSSGVSSGTTVNTNTWNFLATNFTPGGSATAYIHVNGASAGSQGSMSISIDSNRVIIGGQENGAGTTVDQLFDGVIDEVRISNVARSDQWIKTEYNNQNSPITFHYRNASETSLC